MKRSIEISDPFDLVSTVTMLKVGRTHDGGWWWPARTSERAGTVHVQRSHRGVTAEGWGPGAADLLDRIPIVLGVHDRMEIEPVDPKVRDLLRRNAGTRLGATGEVFETTVRAILGQLVTRVEAKRSVKRLIDRFGSAAPGPNLGLSMFPLPERIASLSYEDLHGLGIERNRAVTIIESARRARRLDEIMAMSLDLARKRLLAVRGIGPWTAEFVMGVAYGDKDAVMPGDYHLPNTVTYALAGEPRGDDARMFELLEDYRPERRRVIVSLKAEGVHAPRYGPLSAIRDHL